MLLIIFDNGMYGKGQVPIKYQMKYGVDNSTKCYMTTGSFNNTERNINKCSVLWECLIDHVKSFQYFSPYYLDENNGLCIMKICFFF
jgi:hypothetical protein